jgi:hypothetical protein
MRCPKWDSRTRDRSQNGHSRSHFRVQLLFRCVGRPIASLVPSERQAPRRMHSEVCRCGTKDRCGDPVTSSCPSRNSEERGAKRHAAQRSCPSDRNAPMGARVPGSSHRFSPEIRPDEGARDSASEAAAPPRRKKQAPPGRDDSARQADRKPAGGRVAGRPLGLTKLPAVLRASR